jgi:glycine C-acetyltransferase
MIDIRRTIPRFDIKFKIMSKEITGKGVNISQKGFGVVTEKKLTFNYDVFFDAEVHGFIFSDKTYSIKGKMKLLHSTKSKKYLNSYYNGFKFTKIKDESYDTLYELLEDIRKFQKSPFNDMKSKSLANFYYYPSDDIFYKANIFYNAMTQGNTESFEMFSYFLDSANSTTSKLVNKNTNKNKEMIMMGSNNYLGLTTHPEVIKASIEAVKKYGTGNGSGAMVGGTLTIHKKLEEELADFIGKESVMIFNSGYSTNVGTISGILRQQDAVIIDQMSHASIYDGCSLCSAKTLIFAHNDSQSLEKIIKRTRLTYNGILIVVDGIYSTDGKIAPLEDIVKIAQKYNARIMVDEAHGFGILGKKGIGAVEHCNLVDKTDLIMGTMSKSLAGVGGFIASSKDVIHYLRFYGHSYLFSTNIPPSTAGSILKALQLIRDDSNIREKLHYNIEYFKKRLSDLKLNIGEPAAAIIPIFISDNNLLFRVSSKLFNKGIFHNVMLYPAVPLGGSLLRFGIMATHSEKELKKACDIIEEVAIEEKLI